LNFEASFEYLNNFSNYEKKAHLLKPVFSLDGIRRLLGLIGNPEEKFPSIHVAGTVGKGSVCHMTESVLRHSGYKTGLYTSPHFTDVRERLRINGRMISMKKFAEGVERLRNNVGDDYDELTYFEMLTALAFDIFAREKVDIAVVEVGLGGRLDATNTVPPFVCAVTRLGWDHVKVLGPKLSDIAREKAGIVKPGGIVVSAPQHYRALAEIRSTCKKRGARLRTADISTVVHCGSSRVGERFETTLTGSEDRSAINLPLAGGFQKMNLAVALAVLDEVSEKGFSLPVSSVVEGLENLVFPGRMEWVETVKVGSQLLLDGAHNVTAASALARALESAAGRKCIVFVAAMMRDKDAPSVLEALSAAGSSIVVCGMPYDRAVPAQELAGVARRFFRTVRTAPDVRAGLELAGCMATGCSMICVTGSLYAVAEAKLFLDGGKSLGN